MSRVDDDRDAARAEARLAEARRATEAQKTRKAQEGNAFSQKVGEQKQQGQVVTQQSAAKSAIAKLLEEAEGKKLEGAQAEGTLLEHAVTEQHTQENSFKGRLGQKAVGEKNEQAGKQTNVSSEKGRVSDHEAQGNAEQSRSTDTSAAGRSSAGRASDAKSNDRVSEKRKESIDGASTAGAGGARGEQGDLKADSDSGGGASGGGGKDKDQNNPGAASANFRFNPALMAPVGVAKPKEATGSDRLRKVANELAQKIVEKVRVGTNAAGKVEFQVDLRSDVLAGLSVKVSAQNGKIRAVFSGKDRDVLKMIQEQGDALKHALTARGLTLEEFKIEARP